MAAQKTPMAAGMAMLVLKLLSEKDRYGYEMIDVLRRRSQNVFELKAGTLYPLLHGLEEQGLLSVYEKETLGKIRKYYRITEKGRQALKEKTEEWQHYSQAVTQVLMTEG